MQPRHILHGVRQFCSASTSSKSSFYDIIVSGGGMVGNAFACSCGVTESLREKRVLVLEAGPGSSAGAAQRDPSQKYSNRVSAISPGSRKLFENLGIWKHLESQRVKPVKQLQVWESCSESRIHYEFPNFESEVAWIVENDLIIAALAEQIKKQPNVEIRTKSRAKEFSLPQTLRDPVRITLEDDSVLESKLLVGADGFQSSTRKAMNVDYVTWEYGQRGLVATLKLAEKCANDVAWQRFTPTGPIALLPLSEELTSLVWSTTEDEAKELLEVSGEEFIDRLNQALWTDAHQDSFANSALQFFTQTLLDKFSSANTDAAQFPPTIMSVEEGSRAAFPLGLGHPLHYVRPRTVLIGDAAHRCHPLAGRGVNLGFGDVGVLTGILDTVARNGGDLGSETYLREYETRRQRKNVRTMLGMDWLNRLYSTDSPPLVALRSLGLATVNRLQPLKRLIMQEASS